MTLDWKVLQAVFMLVTPEMALAWLGRNHERQRHIRGASMVGKLVQDMLNERFRTTHQGVAFDWNGNLIDGQHRLTAIARSGKSVTMLVTTGLDPQCMSDIDTMIVRRLPDLMRGAGLGQLDNTEAGTIDRVMMGNRQIKGSTSHETKMAFYAKHAEAFEFAFKALAKRQRKVTVAPVLAAVVRAFYHEDRALLAEFCEVMTTGIMTKPIHAGIIRWREILMSGPTRNSNSQAEIYGKTTRVIEALADGENITRFYMPNEDIYPLPKDAQGAGDGVDDLPTGNRRIDQRGQRVGPMVAMASADG